MNYLIRQCRSKTLWSMRCKLFAIITSRDGDIAVSIKHASSCGDYFKNYGYFYMTKTSQNYANTIEALANYEKTNVKGLHKWYSDKVAAKAKKASNQALGISEYKQAISHDKALLD